MELRKFGLGGVGSDRRGIQAGSAQLERGRIAFVGLVEDGKAGRWPWPRLSSAALPLGLP